MHVPNSAQDLVITQKENQKKSPQINFELKAEKKYSRVDDEKQFYKGIIFAIPISLALWCIIFSLAIVIF